MSSYVLRTRQGLLVAVGLAYVLILAWFNRQPIPTTTLMHESDSPLKLRTTGASHLGSRNKDMHWIEPARYLEPATADKLRPPGVTDIDAGLLHIRLHTEFRTTQPQQPLCGLLKVYRKGLRFVQEKGLTPSKEAAWELLFVDRLPGPVQLAHLDRTRIKDKDGSHGHRRLAVLYYIPGNETVSYRTRIYDLETLHKTSRFDYFVGEVGGTQWWGHQKRISKDAMAAAKVVSAVAKYRLCPDDRLKLADAAYGNHKFTNCVGPSGLTMKHIDVPLPGALEVIEFSLRGTTLLYSRRNDIVRFRMLELPVSSDSTSLVADASKSVQSVGPDVTEYLRDVGSQSFLVQLHSTRPGHGTDLFLAHGNTASDTFFFSFSLLQNTTRTHRWIHEDVKRYRLPVHHQFSGLSRDELRLVNDAPLVDQVGLTSVFYFKATDIIVAVDTEWFQDHGSSNVTQLQRVRDSRPPYISTLNSPVAVNMTLDESGALLAMSTVDDELFIFSRAHSSSIKRIVDYRRYFRNPLLMPWIATDPVSSIDVLEEGETDIFNWQLRLTWQPNTLISVTHWESGFVSPDNPFPTTQRIVARPQNPSASSTTCLRFLHFDPVQISGSNGKTETGGSILAPRRGDPAPAGIVRVFALSASGKLRMWELASHEQSPHILWPFITEHWGLMFMLAAVVSCCVYNERRWG